MGVRCSVLPSSAWDQTRCCYGRASEPKVSTAAIVATMLRASKQVSDLSFPRPGPQVEINGQLREVNMPA